MLKDTVKALPDWYGPFLFVCAGLFFAYQGLYILNSNSLTNEKQTIKFSSANFQKMSSPSYVLLRIQKVGGKQCRSR